MSLEIAAKKLAAKGRNGDTLLVHMHPQEVAGLQALARIGGTQLTRNPETGLPEAFSLRSMLPMLAGAAMTYFSGGAINPYMAAGLVGAGTAASTGSINKGLLAGLGAYGGGSLGTGLAESAAAGMGEGAVSEAAQQQAAQQAAATGGAPAAMGTNQAAAAAAGKDAFMEASAGDKLAQLGEGSTWSGAADAMGGYGNMGKAGLMGVMGGEALDVPGRPGQVRVPGSIRPYRLTRENVSGQGPTSAERQQVRDIWQAEPVREAAGGGIMRLAGGGQASTTGAYRPEQVYGTGQTGAYSPAATYGAGAAPAAKTPASDASRAFATPVVPAAKLGLFATRPDDTAPSATYSTSAPAYGKYIYDPSSGQFNVNPNWAASKAALDKAQTYVNDQLAPPDSGNIYGMSYAQGGIASLGGYSDGGQLLRGPGNGTSDSIPATIGGKQPARLAEGEFVVPARIVSELGNGSTEAGAKELYAMMDRIQKKRAKTVGKNRVAADPQAYKELPA